MAWWDEGWSKNDKDNLFYVLSQIREDLRLHSRRLGRIESRLNILATQGEAEMATVQELVDKVHATTGVVASLTVAVDGVQALVAANNAKIAELIVKLEEAIAANDPAAIQAAVDELTAANDAATAEVADLTALVPAVTENP